MENFELEGMDLEELELEEDIEFESEEVEFEEEPESEEELELEEELESEDGEFGEEPESEELAEYEGEDGRPYSEYEKVGTNETVRGDEGVLRIYHKNKDEDGVDSVRGDYQDRMTEYTERVQAGGTFEGFDGSTLR